MNAYLRVVNATGRPLAPADATGLRRILPIFQAAGFADRVFSRDEGTNAGTYRVEAPTWALRIPISAGGAKATGTRDDAARVDLADVTLTVMPDRSVLGRALYDLDPDGGRMLTVNLPADGVILWAADEPEPTVPLRDGASRWSFAVDPDRLGRVCVIWRTPPPRGDGAPARPCGGMQCPAPASRRAGPGHGLATARRRGRGDADGLQTGLARRARRGTRRSARPNDRALRGQTRPQFGSRP